jgi:hypothetical protein
VESIKYGVELPHSSMVFRTHHWRDITVTESEDFAKVMVILYQLILPPSYIVLAESKSLHAVTLQECCLLGSFIATGYHSSRFSQLTTKKYMQCLVSSGCCNKYHKLGALSTNLFLTALKDGSLKSWCLCMGSQVADIKLYLHMHDKKEES